MQNIEQNELNFHFELQREINEQQIVPPPPPGSPPPQLPQPKLKDPEKFIVNQLLYFHYDIRRNEMIVTPAPHLMPMMNAMPPNTMALPPPVVQQTAPPPTIQKVPPVPVQPYPFKSNSSRHHNDAKVLKSSRTSSSKHYHSSHKSMHVSNDTNLIVLSSSPSNA